MYIVITSDLCLTVAVQDQESHSGTYQYYGTQSVPLGLIWYNRDNQKYLYPWNIDEGVIWVVASSPNDTVAGIVCGIANATSTGYYAILDIPCNNWYYFSSRNFTWVRTSQIFITQGDCKGRPTPSPTTTMSSTMAPTIFCNSSIPSKACYIHLNPSNESDLAQTITIESDIDGYDSNITIYLINGNTKCLSPSIDLYFEKTNFGSSYEYFTVYNNHNEMMVKCNGDSDGNCGKWIQCLHSYPLSINEIGVNESYQMRIFKPSLLNYFWCDHQYVLRVNLTMTCSNTYIPTINPTVPSNTPTSAPTSVPPNHLHCDGILWRGGDVDLVGVCYSLGYVSSRYECTGTGIVELTWLNSVTCMGEPNITHTDICEVRGLCLIFWDVC